MMLFLLACTAEKADSSAPLLDAALADAGADLVVEVGQPATFDGTASTGVAFTWAFGDGSTADGASATHTYASPGNYVAVLTVTGEDGASRSDSARVTAYLPPAATAPTWSRTMVIEGERAWVVNPEAGSVAVVDISGRDELAVCAQPVSLALDGTTLAVACEGSQSLMFLDTTTQTLTEGASLPAAPVGVVGRGGVFYASLTNGQVATVQNGAVTLTEVGPDPRALAIGSDGAVYVSRFRAGEAGAEIYVLGGASIPLTTHPGPDSDTETGGVPNLIEQLLITPDGGTLFVPSLQANTGRGLYQNGLALTHDTSLRAALSVVDTSTRAESFAERKQFDNQDRVGAVAISPLGSHIYVVHPGTSTIQVVDAWTRDVVGSLHDAGEGITGVEVVGETLYVYAWLDREVRAYTLGSVSDIPTLAWSQSTVTTEPLDATVLLGKRLFHDSGDTRIALDGYIACASCHPGGDQDGQTWDFTDRGEGLRNTISLLGRAGTGMGPLHWSANFDEVQDFENDMRNAFGGTGFLSDEQWATAGDTLGTPKAGMSADLDALAAYVSSLAATPASPWPTAEGAELYTEAGCADCHPSPSYTDSSLSSMVRHDIGTITDASGGRLGGELDGLDTPTLLGAWATAPYLHDGSAATLAEAIAAHNTVSLSADDVAILAAYVGGL